MRLLGARREERLGVTSERTYGSGSRRDRAARAGIEISIEAGVVSSVAIRRESEGSRRSKLRASWLPHSKMGVW